MNPITAYIKGLNATFQSIRIWLWLYFVNVFVALLVAMPLYYLLEDKLSYSLEASKLLEGFNYTVVQDFRNEYGDVVAALLGQSQFFILLFVLLYVFLTGGILTVFKTLPDALNPTEFGKGCKKFFSRFLRLMIYFLILQVGLGAIFVGIFVGTVDTSCDKCIMHTILMLAPLFVILSSILMMVHDYAKIEVVQSDEKLLFQPIKNAFRFTFRHFFKTLSLYWLNILTFVVTFGLYWLAKTNLPADTGSGIVMVFILGQIFLLLRIGLKLLNLSSATVMYQRIKRAQ